MMTKYFIGYKNYSHGVIIMNESVTKGSNEDYEEIIAFGNRVFNVDFPSLLPKLYVNHQESSIHHHLVKEGNAIKAMVGSFPLDLNVCGIDLKVRGIGTVSVDKDSRGSGYMKVLMDNAVSEMRAEDYDFAVLSGQRQRYEYWDFTPCGVTINLNFNSSNIKHTKIATNDRYKFIKYDRSKDIDLAEAVNLHDSQLVHARRPKSAFVEISRSWNNNLIFIYKNDEFSGYLCASDNYQNISEIVLQNPQEIDKMFIAYMNNFNLEESHVVLYLHRSEEVMKLSSLCENYTISSSANIYIINYEKVIKAFMELKKTYSLLCDGTLVLNVKNIGRYQIVVKNGEISVQQTDMAYDLSLSHLDASALLFSQTAFINASNDFTHPIVKAWFPLPLFFPNIDNV